MRSFDVVVIGAGAAGMMCAIAAGRRGRSVLVLDHAAAPGEKIRISGGGRCNFTNRHTAPDRFLSGNPRFAVSALKRYTPADFIALVDRHGIAWHEKTLGQLFCNGSARQVVTMLVGEMAAAGVELRLRAEIGAVTAEAPGFGIAVGHEVVRAQSLVVASGGKSIPKMGASGLAYRLAGQFGLKVTETRPGLVPLTFDPHQLERWSGLSGVSTEARVAASGKGFTEALLFTHRGLSGPAVLQASNYWREGQSLSIDLMPGRDAGAWLREEQHQRGRAEIQTVLAGVLPRSLALMVAGLSGVEGRLAGMNKAALDRVAAQLNAWTVTPTGSEGYRTAEVTLGGIDTDGLDGRSMAARSVPGLYFIGEAVDVTGWLGGYNFQWAWASGHAAGQAA